MKLFLLSSFLLLASISFSQSAIVRGHVKTSDGKPAESVTITLKPTAKISIADRDGNYEIKNIKPGRYTISTSFIGLETQELKVEVQAGQTYPYLGGAARNSSGRFAARVKTVRTVSGNLSRCGRALQEPHQAAADDLLRLAHDAVQLRLVQALERRQTGDPSAFRSVRSPAARHARRVRSKRLGVRRFPRRAGRS